MARHPKHINVIAEADPQAPDGIRFRLEKPDGTALDTLVFDKTKENMPKPDEHEVHFHLIQDSGMTLEFAQNLRDVFWINWGPYGQIPACPNTRPPNTPDPVFFAEKSSPNLLKAVNKNLIRQSFSFCLNFVDPHSATPTKLIPYDPGGDNEDGGIGNFSLSGAMIGAIAGAICAAGAVSFAGNTFEPSSALLYGLGGGIVGLIVGLVLGRF